MELMSSSPRMACVVLSDPLITFTFNVFPSGKIPEPLSFSLTSVIALLYRTELTEFTITPLIGLASKSGLPPEYIVAARSRLKTGSVVFIDEAKLSNRTVLPASDELKNPLLVLTCIKSVAVPFAYSIESVSPSANAILFCRLVNVMGVFVSNTVEESTTPIVALMNPAWFLTQHVMGPLVGEPTFFMMVSTLLAIIPITTLSAVLAFIPVLFLVSFSSTYPVNTPPPRVIRPERSTVL